MWPLRKIENEVAARPPRAGETLIVLVNSGSFNPPNRFLRCMMELAEKAAEQHHNGRVVGGFVVPSSDAYVQSKFGRNAYRLDHRVEMCRLAAQDSLWLDASPVGLADSGEIVRDLERALQTRFGALFSSFKVIRVFQSDYVSRMRCWNSPMICVSRKGSDGDVLAAIGRKEHHRDFVFVDERKVASATKPTDPLATTLDEMQRILPREALFRLTGGDDFWAMPPEQREIVSKLSFLLPDPVLRYILLRGASILSRP